MAKKLKDTEVVTGVNSRLSYANVWKPVPDNGGDLKYMTSILIPKDDKATVDAINKAIDAAIKQDASKFGGKVPAKTNLKLPLRDGDTERPEDENYKGHYFLNAKSSKAPQIARAYKVDGKFPRIEDESEVYSGCYCRVKLNFYAYNTNGNRGIAVGLGNIQKIKDGTPFGGMTNAEDDFDEIEADDDNLDFLNTDDLPF